MWKIDVIFIVDVFLRNMVVFWSLKKLGSEIYLFLNEGRVVSIENGEDLGVCNLLIMVEC